MQNNIPAVLSVMQYIYDNIMYAELNTKSDYCEVCGYDGEIKIVEDETGKLVWECPNCGNRDQDKLIRSKTYLRIYRNPVLESGQNTGDQGTGITFIKTGGLWCARDCAATVFLSLLRRKDMNYSAIKYCDIANGTGVRTVLFVSGCRNHCKDCFQPETWAFEYGNPFTGEVEDEIIASLKPDYIRGLTLLGGDPFEPENQKALLPFMRRVKAKCPGKDVWAYTGYVFRPGSCAGRKNAVPQIPRSCFT